MAQPTSALVDYGATSSEDDNFSDLESRDRALGSPLAASSPRLPRWSSNESLVSPSDCSISSPEQSDRQVDEIAQAADGPWPEVLTVRSSTDEEEEVRETTQPSRVRWQEEEGERNTPTDGEDSDSENSDQQDAGGEAPPVLVHSSSEEEKPAAKRARLQVTSRRAQGRGAYAMKFRQLTPEMRDLLTRSRAFFTKPHSLQRPGGPVAVSTYSKAEERISVSFSAASVCVYMCLLQAERPAWRCDNFGGRFFFNRLCVVSLSQVIWAS